MKPKAYFPILLKPDAYSLEVFPVPPPVSSLIDARTARFVLANGSLSSNQPCESDIRKNVIEGDVVDRMVALPGQLFYTPQIHVCLWHKASRSADRWTRGMSMIAGSVQRLYDAGTEALIIERMGTISSLDQDRTMTFPVLVRPAGGQFEATLVGAPDVRATASTRDQALAALGSAIEKRLDRGELVALEVRRRGLAGLFGKYQDDPTLRGICAETYQERDADVQE